MDMMSMVTSLLAAKSGGVQMQVAATIMKSNADAEKFAVQTLLGAGASSLANVGVGRRRQSRYFALNPLLPSLRCVAKIAAESYRPERPHDMSKTGTTRVTVKPG
ncbi:MAG TPA: hypothetical protein VK621_08980, partial [Bradyrhizobium sp.]|nr:hypothetical protein [Bradyrhizobium sp.]